MGTSSDGKLSLLDKTPFFDLFDELEKQALTQEKTCFQMYQVNEEIIRNGDKDDTLFVLLKGSVVVTKGTTKEVTLAQLKSGDIFGELSLILRRPRTTTIIAKSEVLVWKMDAKLLQTLGLDIQNKIQFKIVQLMVKRLDEMKKKYIKVVKEKTAEQSESDSTLPKNK